MRERINDALRRARAALDQAIANPAVAVGAARAAELLVAAFREGRKVLGCGNGGSACDAGHFAEELTGRFRKDRPALPAIACTDAGHITCTANDYGFDVVFSRWVEALGNKGDVLILLSTSGNSENIVRAAKAGRDRGLTTVALLGGDGGRVRGTCDVEIIVPGEGSDRVQELHMLILHALVEAVEEALFDGARRTQRADVCADETG
jgi:D-sedoheptulose 7-phosphate isomerase